MAHAVFTVASSWVRNIDLFCCWREGGGALWVDLGNKSIPQAALLRVLTLEVGEG